MRINLSKVLDTLFLLPLCNLSSSREWTFYFFNSSYLFYKTTTNSSIEYTLSACCLWESYSFSPWSFYVWIRAIDLSLELPSNDFTVQKKKKSKMDGSLGQEEASEVQRFSVGMKTLTQGCQVLPKVKWEVSTLIRNRIQSSLMLMQWSPCTAIEYKV